MDSLRERPATDDNVEMAIVNTTVITPAGLRP
jgi:hypothetical protein